MKPKSDCIYHFLIDLKPNGAVRLVPNQPENGKYNLISVQFNKIWKIFLCMQVASLFRQGRLQSSSLEPVHRRWEKKYPNETFQLVIANPNKLTHCHMAVLQRRRVTIIVKKSCGNRLFDYELIAFIRCGFGGKHSVSPLQ